MRERERAYGKCIEWIQNAIQVSNGIFLSYSHIQSMMICCVSFVCFFCTLCLAANAVDVCMIVDELVTISSSNTTYSRWFVCLCDQPTSCFKQAFVDDLIIKTRVENKEQQKRGKMRTKKENSLNWK